MKTEFFRIQTSDKLLLQGLVYTPEQTTDKVVIHIHGMAGNFYENRFLDPMAKTFTENGWSFMAVNTRGHDYIADFPLAGNEEKYVRRGNTFEQFVDCLEDIRPAVDFAATRGFTTIVLQGHSLGAVKVTYYLGATRDPRISRLVLASPPDMVGLFEQDGDIHQQRVTLARELVTKGQGKEILPQKIWGSNYLSAETYLDFSIRDNPIDVFNTYDEAKSSVLAKINVPIFAFLGSKDDAMILPLARALQVLKEKATSCPRFDTDIIEGAPHSYFGHEEEAARRILEWLGKNLGEAK